MKTREILEQLCTHGDNVWQTGMLQLRFATISPFLEAWSQQRKAEIVRKNAEHGIDLEDHIVLGDYDLVLWKVPVKHDVSISGILWVVSINSEQHDPSEQDIQKMRFPGTAIHHLPIVSISEVLRKWVTAFGKLAIGTTDLRKLEIYRRMCQRMGFKMTDMDPQVPRAGFFIE